MCRSEIRDSLMGSSYKYSRRYNEAGLDYSMPQQYNYFFTAIVTNFRQDKTTNEEKKVDRDKKADTQN